MILSAARNDDFRITGYAGLKFGGRPYPLNSGRAEEWKEMASIKGVVGVSCWHFGGDLSVAWAVEVDTGHRGPTTGDMVKMEANGGDM